MKRMKLWIVAAAMVCCGMGMFTSCQDGNKADAGKQAEETELSPAEVEEAARLKAINRFLVDSIGKHYESGEVCIPCVHIVGTEEQDSDAMMVWGDFWVFNYNVEADTLMMVSGGDHPGLMRLNKFDNGYMVTGWQEIGGKVYYFNEEDGSLYGALLMDGVTPDRSKVDETGARKENGAAASTS